MAEGGTREPAPRMRTPERRRTPEPGKRARERSASRGRRSEEAREPRRRRGEVGSPVRAATPREIGPRDVAGTEDWMLLHEPYSSWLRELYNNRRRLRVLMKPW